MNRLHLLSNLKKTIKKHPNKKSITIIRLLKKIYTKSKKQVKRRKSTTNHRKSTTKRRKTITKRRKTKKRTK